jgi:hypothetical protein
MTNKTQYGELVPGFFLVKKESEQLGVQYTISHDGIDIFYFKTKPVSLEKYCELESKKALEKGLGEFCYTGWYYNAKTSTANFSVTPRIGFRFYNSIVESGWDVEKLNKEKRYQELDQAVYIYNLSGKLIENHEEES